MAISDTQKVDYLWKKIGYAATKTDTTANKDATNEALPSPLQIRGDSLLVQSSSIPSSIPATTTSIVSVYRPDATLEMPQTPIGVNGPGQRGQLGSATAYRTWQTGFQNWISPEFGATYSVRVFLDTAGRTTSNTTGTELFATATNEEWFFDYQSGVLNFSGANLPSGISTKSVYISGARYTGEIGIANTVNTAAAAFAHANAAFAAANAATATDATQNNSITAAFNQANAAFSAANNATDTYVRNHANSAFDTANGAVAVNLTQNNSIAAAFTRANNSLSANAGGTITGDVTVTGNLVVVGNTVYANTLTVLIADNIITLNAAISQSGSPLANAGIEVDRGIQPNATFLWVEADGKWAANNGNTMFYVGSESDITAAGNYANAAFAIANSAAAGTIDTYARDTANAAFLAANNISVVGNTINLGTPTDGSLTNVGAYSGWTTTTKVTDAIDDLNEMLDNVRSNTFVKSVSFTASPLGAGSGSVVTLTVAPVTSNGTLRYDVDWGDGGANTTACTTTTIAHTYTVQGSKTITVRAYNNSGSGTGSEASNTRSSYVVIYTPDPVMGFRFYRVSSGGNALTSAANLYFTEGDTLYMENTTTNTTGAAVTYTANFGDNQPNTSIASDTASGGVFGSRLAYTYGFAASSGTGYATANLVLTSSNTSNPSSIPRSVTTSIKVYDANIAAPNPLSSKTISFTGSTGTLPYLAAQYANNTGGALTYTVGTLVNRTTATSGNIAIADMTTFAANANVGTLTAFVNGANSGARAFTNGTDTGTFNSLSILSESDYNLLDATGTATTFAASIYSPGYFTGFKANVSTAAAAVPLGVNNFQLQHSANGNTNVVEFVKDDVTSAPTTTAGTLTVGTANYRYISGIPYFKIGRASCRERV